MVDLVEKTCLGQKDGKLSQNGCCWAALQSWTDDNVNKHFVPCKWQPFCRGGYQPGGTRFCQWSTLGMEPPETCPEEAVGAALSAAGIVLEAA